MIALGQAQDAAHALKCELAGEVLRCFGRLRLQVTGWSMLPAIWPGDTLELTPATCTDVSEGDIVLFRRHARLFAHRVLRTNESTIVTRGDALPYSDSAVGENEVLGRVISVDRNGKCIRPSGRWSLAQRAIAIVVRSSDFAARVVVGVHGICKATQVKLEIHRETLA